MNALERANLIADLEGEISDCGTPESLEVVLGKMGYKVEKLDRHTLAAIDERFFTCDQCNWTHNVNELSETEVGDGFLCKECTLGCAEGYPDL